MSSLNGLHNDEFHILFVRRTTFNFQLSTQLSKRVVSICAGSLVYIQVHKRSIYLLAESQYICANTPLCQGLDRYFKIGNTGQYIFATDFFKPIQQAAKRFGENIIVFHKPGSLLSILNEGNRFLTTNENNPRLILSVYLYVFCVLYFFPPLSPYMYA